MKVFLLPRALFFQSRRLLGALFLLCLPVNLMAAPDASFYYRPDLGSASPKLDIHTFDGATSAPVIIFIHGGGWQIGKRSHVQSKAAHFNNLGFIFVSLDYRLVPKVSVATQLEDIDNALDWVSTNIGRFGGDGNNLHLLGHLAGAHLASMTGVAPGRAAERLLSSGALRSVISNDTRAYDLPRIAKLSRGGKMPKLYVKAFGDDPPYWKSLSPGLNVNAKYPNPAFLILYSGQGDDQVRRSFATGFAKSLKAAGTSVQVFDGSKYSHSEINKLMGKSNAITATVDQFLKANSR